MDDSGRNHGDIEKKRDRNSRRSQDRDKEEHRDRRDSRHNDRDKDRTSRENREKEKQREKRHHEKVRERKKEKKRTSEKRRRELDRDYYDRVSDDERDRRHHDRKRTRSEMGVTERKKLENDMVEDQRKLNEEMDNRRRRWQELKKKNENTCEKGNYDGRRDKIKEEDRRTRERDLKKEDHKLDEFDRKKQESENKNFEKIKANLDEPKCIKKWSLDEESGDDEAALTMNTDTDEYTTNGGGVVELAPNNSTLVIDTHNGDAYGEEEIDPLDAFMNSMVMPQVEKLNNLDTTSLFVDVNPDSNKDLKNGQAVGSQSRKGKVKSIGRILPGEDSDSDYEDLEIDEVPSENEDEFMRRVKNTKVEKLSLVDHSKIQCSPFQKNFYIEVRDIGRMTLEEVAYYRKQLELKIHGKDIPKPVKTWTQIGLTSQVLEMIKRLGYEKSMPIQAQTLPVIMSVRDCIGIAKTGSGKTLAFVLPMLRHIKDQPPLVAGDGPIGLIMASTRELVQQIHSDIKKFAKVVGVNCVPVYGGSGVAQQISDLKRGTEIVVCTPGRMIDILCKNSGKITNLHRVTYLVMDEADRMFDMGFEPQITRIVQNIRPDCQTVLFSATFPRQVEILACQVLTKPVEIQVGGRSVVNTDITQLVEMRSERERFLRLFELLGEWYERGKTLIFVQSQDKCDSLFRDLLKHGYPCLSLHGAKDQSDRESTISDFKNNVCNLLVAKSIAARGLDVKELELVINLDVPNHYEDYVHHVGQTGRAGRKGCSITFISEEDARYAPDLVQALELSKQVVPADLKALADGFMKKVRQGLEQDHGTGYGGSGFKFNEEEDEVRKAAKKAQAREYFPVEDKSDSDSEDEGIRKEGGGLSQEPAVCPGTSLSILPNYMAAKVQHNLDKFRAACMPEHYEAEFEINNFPQNVRWKMTRKETLNPISEWTGAAITTKGQHYQPGRNSAIGDRKLYLFIEGPTEASVKEAKVQLKHVLEKLTLPGASQPGKYTVL